MVLINVLCPGYGGLDVVKHGKLPNEEQQMRSSWSYKNS